MEVQPRGLLGEIEVIHGNLRIVRISAKIQTQRFPNNILGRYRYAIVLGKKMT